MIASCLLPCCQIGWFSNRQAIMTDLIVLTGPKSALQDTQRTQPQLRLIDYSLECGVTGRVNVLLKRILENPGTMKPNERDKGSKYLLRHAT